jgi:hypothetical protein
MIHNVVKMYKYDGKQVSFLLSITVALLKAQLDGKQNDRGGGLYHKINYSLN